ncbi:MAG TPA: nuclear transport factor 2 family protein [Solirubrobacterales bacterium]
MSEENVELVRRAIDAYNRRDLDGLFENWAPDAVVDWSNSHGLDARVFRGREEIRPFARRFLETFDEGRIEVLDVVEVDAGVVVVDNVTFFRGRDDIEVQARAAWLIVIENGVQMSLTLYQTKEEALEAAGLRE